VRKNEEKSCPQKEKSRPQASQEENSQKNDPQDCQKEKEIIYFFNLKQKSKHLLFICLDFYPNLFLYAAVSL